MGNYIIIFNLQFFCFLFCCWNKKCQTKWNNCVLCFINSNTEPSVVHPVHQAPSAYANTVRQRHNIAQVLSEKKRVRGCSGGSSCLCDISKLSK